MHTSTFLAKKKKKKTQLNKAEIIYRNKDRTILTSGYCYRKIDVGL